MGDGYSRGPILGRTVTMDDVQRARIAKLAGEPKKNRFSPLNCPHCNGEPDWVGPGWIEQTNNGGIVSCPLCNDDGAYPRPSK